MKITEKKIKLREIMDGFVNDDENGVVGYHGKLNIRPAFQREFIYKGEQKNEVIRTILKGFPLNTIYWSVTEDGNYELLDGQQRIMSACTYVTGDFSVKSSLFSDPDMPFNFDNLTKEQKETILDYEFTVYICDGSESQKLEWFRIINIAGEELREQEIRNAMYTGPWLADAKKDFSASSARANKKAKDYLKGERDRQDHLETVLKWISDRDGCKIVDYMSKHQHDTNANELWLYFSAVIDWADAKFPFGSSLKKGLDWGMFYNRYHSIFNPDPKALKARFDDCMEDSDVTKKSGIFEYLLTGDEKHLSIRQFEKNDIRTAYARCGGKCAKCGKENLSLEEMEADHITPWSKGGHTKLDNLQMLCRDCNRRKSSV